MTNDQCDVLTRLREAAAAGAPNRDLLLAAADEIERLREALENTKGHLRYCSDPFYTSALDYYDNGER